ncbi:MAG: branched-chain amino acid ABC transporter permease [Gammaproteobacteria bacterium]|nr:branched-chain amino acid ABC transporter permease [Gammaproteobacteria bacterium]
MDLTLSHCLTHLLNGVQLGMMLFLMAAGLTLVFGIMNLINLAHGALYMLGAYLIVTFQSLTGSFSLALLLALPSALLLGWCIEKISLRTLYQRDHLDQVLATFGLTLFLTELVRIIWGSQAYFITTPAALSHPVTLFGAPYPVYRLLIIAVGIIVFISLQLLIHHTRIGMLIRAGASNREMVAALGVNIRNLYSWIFAVGAMLAGLAGIMAAPLLSVEPSMGDSILILTFVVIVIGGMGSITGAFIAALIVGIVDVVSRVVLPPLFASITIYILMALTLLWRPQGLLGKSS